MDSVFVMFSNDLQLLTSSPKITDVSSYETGDLLFDITCHEEIRRIIFEIVFFHELVAPLVFFVAYFVVICR